MEVNFNNNIYLRPIEIDTVGQVSISPRTLEFITDPIIGESIPYEMSFRKIIKVVEGESVTVDLPAVQPNLQTSLLQAGFINLKHHCIRVAELINDQLRQFLLNYDQLKYIMPTKAEINSKDFSQLRDLFKEILKVDQRFWAVDVLNTPEKRKLYRKTLNDFIEDRNIYTHGHLIVEIDTNRIIIDYKKKGEEIDSACEVNQQIIHSFFQTYIIFRQSLTDLSEMQNKGKK